MTQGVVAPSDQGSSRVKPGVVAPSDPNHHTEPSVEPYSLSITESEQGDHLIQHAEAKRLFGKLSEDAFGEPLRENQWPAQWEYWLDEALPMRRENWKLIDWFYRLPVNHEIFGVTRRRQSLKTVIENLKSEPQKIRQARAATSLNGLHDMPKKSDKAEMDLTSEEVAAAQRLYGEDVPLPREWGQLAPSVRAEIEEEMASENAA